MDLVDRTGKPSRVHADGAERGFVIYAWPMEAGATGTRAFVIDETGEMFFHRNDELTPTYSSHARAPRSRPSGAGVAYGPVQGSYTGAACAHGPLPVSPVRPPHTHTRPGRMLPSRQAARGDVRDLVLWRKVESVVRRCRRPIQLRKGPKKLAQKEAGRRILRGLISYGLEAAPRGKNQQFLENLRASLRC